MKMSDIEKRWNERVVPNGWDKEGAEGAKKYLEKYGKKISDEKLKLFAEYANGLGLKEFADGMLNKTAGYKEFTYDQAEKLNFHEDILALALDGEPGKIIETTIEWLAKNNLGTICGRTGNKCFVNIATKYPNVVVRTWFMTSENATMGIEAKLDNEEQAVEIEQLADDGDGSLRYDGFNESGWAYFESE